MNDLNKDLKDIETSSERIPPRDRFAKQALQFDLKAEATSLGSEHNPVHLGHRQVALYKCDHVTSALFRFDKGGSLPQHKANGAVFIQVIEGALSLSVAGQKHSLLTGGLLVLEPGVLHDVHAEEESLMLLTVCMKSWNIEIGGGDEETIVVIGQ